MGPKKSGKEYALDGSQAIFTTGVSLSMVPSSVSGNFFRRYLEGIEYVQDNGIFFIDCRA